MEKIIKIQREKLDSFYKTAEEFIFNLYNANKLDYDSKLVLADKLRLINNKLLYLEDDMYEILSDLNKRKCNLTPNAQRIIEEEDQTNTMIREISPILLLYLMNRNT